MGHEFAGKVVGLGNNVETMKVGDYVAAIPNVGCGDCEHCKQKKFNLCIDRKVIGGHFPGALANYTVVPEGNLIKIPEQFTATEGAMIESIAVAVHSVRRMEKIEGKRIAVLGTGPIGLFVIQVLKAFGARLIVASDPIERRREIAGKLGADHVIDPKNDSIEEYVKNHVGEIGLDGVFDCAGLELTLRQALTVTKNGGEIVITALFGKDPVIPMHVLQRGEKKLLGTQMYVEKDFEVAVQLVRDNKIKIDDMVTHRFALEHVGDAYELAVNNSHDVGKIVIDVGN
jgi:L-iditol 2-dehydrogenase